MAAATAVTTVAPAIANAEVTSAKDVKFDEIRSKIEAALAEKYTANTEFDGIKPFASPVSLADYEKSTKLVVLSSTEDIGVVDGIRIIKPEEKVVAGEAIASAKTLGANHANVYVVEKMTYALRNKLETLSTDGKVIVASIIDKGVEAGSPVVKDVAKKHYVTGPAANAKTEALLGKAFTDLRNNFDSKISYVKSLKVITSDDFEVKEIEKGDTKLVVDPAKVIKVEVELMSGTKYALQAGSTALDLENATDLNGDPVVVTKINQQSVADKIKAFNEVTNDDDLKVTVDVPTGKVEEYVFGETKLKRVDKEIVVEDALDAEGRYTVAGADVVNRIIRSKQAPFVFNYDGVQYGVERSIPGKEHETHYVNEGFKETDYKTGIFQAVLNKPFKESKIEAVEGGFVLKFDMKATDKNNEKNLYTLKFQFKAKTQKALKELVDDFVAGKEVVPGDFIKVAGSNRYATAVEVSKEKFADKAAKSIVIVGGEAVIDGLSAAPLASHLEAPILVADKKAGLNDETKAEIKRVLDVSKKTVYVVGGKNSVPEAVEKQLADMGLAVVRLHGDTRYDTSLEVYKKLKERKAIDTKVFAIGGHGEADAMSISPVAADQSSKTGKVGTVTPIVVIRKSGLDGKIGREIVASTNSVDVIGGLSSVSDDAFTDLRKAIGTHVNRISGANRYATNLAVIKEYYDVANANGIVTSGLVVASGKDKNLVDPQTASVIADAKPIMLVDDKLKEDQVKLLDKNKTKFDDRVYQVGGVVTADVMKEVVKTLGL